MNKFYGSHTALVTPFYNGKIDFDTFGALIERQISNGINGLVFNGTTAETPTLTMEEQREIIKFAVELNRGRVPIIVGTGSNSTKHAIDLTKQADSLGADAMLVVCPYYNRPTQEGLFLHFSEIAKSTDKPIILYSIPSRCGLEISIQTTVRLRNSFPNIIGIKEAGGSCNRVSDLFKEVDSDFIVLSGDDALILPFMAIGSKGNISVASNIIPKQLVEMTKLALEDRMEDASEINKKYYPLFKAIFVETNPVPIKQCLFLKGLLRSPEVRLPLCQMDQKNISYLEKTLESITID